MVMARGILIRASYPMGGRHRGSDHRLIRQLRRERPTLLFAHLKPPTHGA
jgi:hypothetical protein